MRKTSKKLCAAARGLRLSFDRFVRGAAAADRTGYFVRQQGRRCLCRAAEAAGSDAGGYAVHAIWDGAYTDQSVLPADRLSAAKDPFSRDLYACDCYDSGSQPAAERSALCQREDSDSVPAADTAALRTGSLRLPAGKRETAALGRRVVSGSMGGCLRRKRQHPDKQAFAD